MTLVVCLSLPLPVPRDARHLASAAPDNTTGNSGAYHSGFHFDQTCIVDSWWMHCYGQYEALDPTDVYLGPLLALDYPLVFDPDQFHKDIKHLTRMAVPAAGDEPPPRRPTPLFEIVAP